MPILFNFEHAVGINAEPLAILTRNDQWPGILIKMQLKI
jgi:hypothetical protein